MTRARRSFDAAIRPPSPAQTRRRGDRRDDRHDLGERAHDVGGSGGEKRARVAVAIDADPDRHAVLGAEPHVLRAVADGDGAAGPAGVASPARPSGRSARRPCCSRRPSRARP